MPCILHIYPVYITKIKEMGRYIPVGQQSTSIQINACNQLQKGTCILDHRITFNNDKTHTVLSAIKDPDMTKSEAYHIDDITIKTRINGHSCAATHDNR